MQLLFYCAAIKAIREKGKNVAGQQSMVPKNVVRRLKSCHTASLCKASIALGNMFEQRNKEVLFP
jgi:hypothetical protein